MELQPQHWLLQVHVKSIIVCGNERYAGITLKWQQNVSAPCGRRRRTASS